jgi:glutathione synthase/RimK-type ligase-like ATP-grasp enzyme
MAGTQKTYSFNKNDFVAQSLPTRLLFIKGVRDDGVVKIEIPKDAPPPPGMKGGNAVKIAMVGSLDHSEHISVQGAINETVLLVGEDEQSFNFKLPAAIINCIVDPDNSTKALIKAQKLIEQIQRTSPKKIPVINPPEAIKQTARDTICTLLGALPGLRIPRVIRITPASVADSLAQIKAGGIKPPFIIRSTGVHGGEGLQRIDDFSDAELLKLERYAYDGQSYYVTEWVDFKSGDGLYRKLRLVCVGGRYIPRHRIIADDWAIHSRSRKVLMAERRELRAEEERFLQTPLADSISSEAMQSLAKIVQLLGLDYFGIDCSIQDDGSVVVFEINAAFNSMIQGDLDIYPYLSKPVNTIIEAFNDLVASKAKIARPA